MDSYGNAVERSEDKLAFECMKCGFCISAFKDKLWFTRNVKFEEQNYVTTDLFSSQVGLSARSTSENCIIVGSECAVCGKLVCASNLCSIFYRQTYCIDCGLLTLHQFPNEIQNKIRKISL